MIGSSEPVPDSHTTTMHDKASHVRLGICILNWNAGPVLTDCVTQARAATEQMDAEIVVVDNCSSDRSISTLLDTYPDVRLLMSPSNLGYARGNNLGANALLGDGCTHLLFMNPDVSIMPNTIQRMLEALDAHPRAACVGGRDPNSALCFRNKPSLTEKFFIYGRLRELPLFVRLLRPVVQKLKRDHYLSSVTTGQPVYAVSGACILFLAEAFAAVEGFDNFTFLYEEEFIMSERLRARKWLVVAAPDALYGHLQEHSTKQIRLSARLYFIKSEQHLLKHYYKCSWPARLLIAAGRYIELGLSVTVAWARMLADRAAAHLRRQPSF